MHKKGFLENLVPGLFYCWILYSLWLKNSMCERSTYSIIGSWEPLVTLPWKCLFNGSQCCEICRLPRFVTDRHCLGSGRSVSDLPIQHDLSQYIGQLTSRKLPLWLPSQLVDMYWSFRLQLTRLHTGTGVMGQRKLHTILKFMTFEKLCLSSI